MAGFVEFFGKIWVWCISLFGGSDYNGGSSGLFPNVTSYLQILELIDVTANKNDFFARNMDFYHDMSSRHGSPNYILNWHSMSGSAAFIPALNSNILFERFFYSLDAGKGHRTLIDKSFIVYTPWSSDWSSPLSPTVLLHVNETAGSMYADDLNQFSRTMEGPEDPRVIYNAAKDVIHLNFNALTPIGDRQMLGSSINFYHDGYEIKHRKNESLIQFEHPKGYRASTEKNWVPILIKNELHYIYSLSPLRILKCDNQTEITVKNVKKKKKHIKHDEEVQDISSFKKTCRVQFKGEPVDSGSQTGALRSGTNWVEHSPGVYFSFARTRIMHSKCSYAIYRPHLIVLKFNIDAKTDEYTDPHIISVSEPITEFDSILFELYAKKGLSNGNKCDDEAVLTPGSISHWTGMTEDENSDIADIIISVNDDMNALLRIKGFGAVVQKAIDSAPSYKQVRSISKKGTLAVNAEREMKKFVEKSFAKLTKKD